MKLGSISLSRSGLAGPMVLSGSTHEPDGHLVIVDNIAGKCALVSDSPSSRWPSMRAALEDWAQAEPYLRELDKTLRSGALTKNVFALSKMYFMAPLPRAFGLIDASAFLSHITLVRRARGAEPPARMHEVPLLYQSLSHGLVGPEEPISLLDESQGLDFEAEIAVILGDIPQGASPTEAATSVRLIALMNDLTLRNLIPEDLASGFGFFHSKPASSFAPFAVTPDELGTAWSDGRLHLPVTCKVNGALVGEIDASEMHFSFPDLLTHATRTRSLCAGTILGSGTVSNQDPPTTPAGPGVACLAERRAREQIDFGEARTRYLRATDSLEIEVWNGQQSVFGAIRQKVV